MQPSADYGGRQKCDEDAEHELPRSRVGWHGLGDIQQAPEIDDEDGKDRAELDQNLEGLAGDLNPRKCPARRICPVDDTGRNSVRPSRRPRSMACQISMWDNAPDRPLINRERGSVARFPAARHALPRPGAMSQSSVAFWCHTAMHTLTHFRLCPHSRSIRIALDELGVEAELVEERPWEWRPEFLASIRPASCPCCRSTAAPIFTAPTPSPSISPKSSTAASTTASSRRSFPAMPTTGPRSAVSSTGFTSKLDREVTRELLFEKIYGQLKVGPATRRTRTSCVRSAPTCAIT